MAFRQTNTEFVNDLMEFSNHGALSQVFIIEAIAKYSKLVAEGPVVELGFIDGKAWHNVAKEIQRKIDKRFEVTQ